MQLIKPSFEIWTDFNEDYNLMSVYKTIEKAGRTCYKSEDKITEGSAKYFVDNVLLKKGHLSPLEHGSIYLRIPIEEYEKNYKNKYFPQE